MGLRISNSVRLCYSECYEDNVKTDLSNQHRHSTTPILVSALKRSIPGGGIINALNGDFARANITLQRAEKGWSGHCAYVAAFGGAAREDHGEGFAGCVVDDVVFGAAAATAAEAGAAGGTGGSCTPSSTGRAGRSGGAAAKAASCGETELRGCEGKGGEAEDGECD